jgi:hypothetical protein
MQMLVINDFKKDDILMLIEALHTTCQFHIDKVISGIGESSKCMK